MEVHVVLDSVPRQAAGRDVVCLPDIPLKQIGRLVVDESEQGTSRTNHLRQREETIAATRFEGERWGNQ